MSDEPKLEYGIDVRGNIFCKVTNEGILLSKEEKDAVIRNIVRLQGENAELLELCRDMYAHARTLGYDHPLLRKYGIEVKDD